MRKSNFLIILLFAIYSFSSQAQESQGEREIDVSPAASSFYNSATVQGLNKNTGKTSVLELQVGQKMQFGTIIVLLHKCWQSPLDQRPENKMLLEIFEEKASGNNKAEKRIFYGWMFSSSPSISSLEHPIYDITAISCK